MLGSRCPRQWRVGDARGEGRRQNRFADAIIGTMFASSPGITHLQRPDDVQNRARLCPAVAMLVEPLRDLLVEHELRGVTLGSQSTSRTCFRNSNAKCAAMLQVSVVLPTPPLLLKKQIGIILVGKYEVRQAVFASHLSCIQSGMTRRVNGLPVESARQAENTTSLSPSEVTVTTLFGRSCSSSLTGASIRSLMSAGLKHTSRASQPALRRQPVN